MQLFASSFTAAIWSLVLCSCYANDTKGTAPLECQDPNAEMRIWLENFSGQNVMVAVGSETILRRALYTNAGDVTESSGCIELRNAQGKVLVAAIEGSDYALETVIGHDTKVMVLRYNYVDDDFIEEYGELGLERGHNISEYQFDHQPPID